jgi:DNA-directed RNA polymerase specialized sigma24 family protein
MDRHELARIAAIAADPETFRRAVRRAGSRELAQDAIQETVRAIAERKSPKPIENLDGFFYVTLIHEIDHQLGRPAAIPDPDIGLTSDRHQFRNSLFAQPAPVEGDAHLRILAAAVLAALEREQARDGLASLIPARSEDPGRYRSAMVWAAKTIFSLLVEGYVTAPDWNAILKTAYPQWCDEPGLAPDARDQRLSRARRDVQQLLRSVLSRDELAS